MSLNRYIIEIDIEAPVLSSSSEVLPMGADTIPLRYRGNPILLGSLVRGVLRHAWNELAELGVLTVNQSWLGQPSDKVLFSAPDLKNSERSVEPLRSLLVFAHRFDLQGNNRERNELIRVEIDSDTDSVKEGALRSLESDWMVGELVKATGWIDAPSYIDSKELTKAIAKGLEWAGSLGMEKGVGFGTIKDVNVSVAERPNAIFSKNMALTSGGGNSFWRLSVDFDRPVCFAKAHGEQGNRYVSEPYVPGGALVAILAAANVLESDELNKLSISHAFKSNERTSYPQSWCRLRSGGTEVIVDASKRSKPFVVKTESGEYLAPQFASDWKGSVSVPEIQLADGPNWLEVHTAVKANSRVTEDEKLFSIFANDSEYGDKPAWCFSLDVSQLSTDSCWKLENWLANGLHGPFGKTDAIIIRADLEECAAPSWELAGDTVSIMLTTDACILDHDIRSEIEGRKSYARFWDEVAEGALSLNQLYVSEKLAGGSYVHKKFNSELPYQPDVLTCAGSVFVFDVLDEQRAGKKLDEWLSRGVPDAFRYSNLEIKEPKTAFRRRPWSPLNGFGRIAPVPLLNTNMPTGWSISDV